MTTVVAVGKRKHYFVTLSLNADWLRQRDFFLNHEGTFGNQEGMIT